MSIKFLCTSIVILKVYKQRNLTEAIKWEALIDLRYSLLKYLRAPPPKKGNNDNAWLFEIKITQCFVTLFITWFQFLKEEDLLLFIVL